MAKKTTFHTLLGFGAMLAISVASAQVYRSVGPDGRVVFSDTPPVELGPQLAADAPADTASSTQAPALPHALRQTAQRYPVALHTSKDCAPCVSGRNLLLARGVPFSEKTIQTHADIEALTQLAGSSSLPLLTIGKQQVKGYSESEWSSYLDAAGYPRTSQLPRNWQPAQATALAPPTPEPADADEPQTTVQDESESSAVPVTPILTPDNPAGIRF